MGTVGSASRSSVSMAAATSRARDSAGESAGICGVNLAAGEIGSRDASSLDQSESSGEGWPCCPHAGTGLRLAFATKRSASGLRSPWVGSLPTTRRTALVAAPSRPDTRFAVRLAQHPAHGARVPTPPPSCPAPAPVRSNGQSRGNSHSPSRPAATAALTCQT
eukprot:COSAG04_NODE_2161_length_4653_cov_10.099473_7_plen_163_part_00